MISESRVPSKHCQNEALAAPGLSSPTRGKGLTPCSGELRREMLAKNEVKSERSILVEATASERDSTQQSRGRQYGYHRQDGTPLAGQSISATSNSIFLPLEDAEQRYAKRARHRTKVDKYEIKDRKKEGRTKQKAGSERHGKRAKHKHEGKSGLILVHGYRAKNVASDRLTVSKPPNDDLQSQLIVITAECKDGWPFHTRTCFISAEKKRMYVSPVGSCLI